MLKVARIHCPPIPGLSEWPNVAQAYAPPFPTASSSALWKILVVNATFANAVLSIRFRTSASRIVHCPETQHPTGRAPNRLRFPVDNLQHPVGKTIYSFSNSGAEIPCRRSHSLDEKVAVIPVGEVAEIAIPNTVAVQYPRVPNSSVCVVDLLRRTLQAGNIGEQRVATMTSPPDGKWC